jgi:hypothetical protein
MVSGSRVDAVSGKNPSWSCSGGNFWIKDNMCKNQQQKTVLCQSKIVINAKIHRNLITQTFSQEVHLPELSHIVTIVHGRKVSTQVRREGLHTKKK